MKKTSYKNSSGVDIHLEILKKFRRETGDCGVQLLSSNNLEPED